MNRNSSDYSRLNLRFAFPYSFLVLSIILFLLPSCYEPQEGCLDIQATNFDAEADNQCPDCCTYPNMALGFRHRVVKADTFFNLVYLDSVYNDDFGQPYRFKNIQFYVSNFHLIRPDGSEELVSDQLQFELQGTEEKISVENNFALVNRNTFTDYTLGTYVVSGDFAGMRFALGVEGEANQADPNTLPEDHPLHIEEDMYFNADSGYVFNRIELFRDTTAADTIPTVLEIGLNDNLREVTLPASFNLIEGFDIVVTLQVDYLTWFRGVDIKNDSEEQMRDKIVQNITESFSIIAVELN